MAANKGIVYLIGAGPGDPGLITVKGLECIKRADVIVYDRLASTRLLNQRQPGAECVFVGKQPGRHTLTQEEINQLLVEKAEQGFIVARLKGGDPFVFGRGGEEAEELVRHGIPFEIIPGITSAIAVPAYAGIPVTHRDYTSSFAVITGNEDPVKENPNIDWAKISTGLGTLVFLMGMGNLAAITSKLVEHGKAPETPVALIRWGTRPAQQTLVGNLENISHLAVEKGFKNPAVIVVGDVVTLRSKLRWYENKPLFGKKVIVTRSRAQASSLAQAIENLGGESVEFPTISLTEPEDYAPLDRALAHLSCYDWLIFTSVNGVEFFFNRMSALNYDIRSLAGSRICAIGPQTAKALQAMMLKVDYMPVAYQAEEIIKGLKDKITPGTRILLPRADIARKVLPEELAGFGATVDEVIAYQTVTGEGDASLLRQQLAQGEIDLVTFTSSSTVRNFMAILKDWDPVSLLGLTRVACIGPITARTAIEMGLTVDIQAKEYTIDGLLQAIVEYYSASSLSS